MKEIGAPSERKMMRTTSTRYAIKPDLFEDPDGQANTGKGLFRTKSKVADGILDNWRKFEMMLGQDPVSSAYERAKKEDV